MHYSCILHHIKPAATLSLQGRKIARTLESSNNKPHPPDDLAVHGQRLLQIVVSLKGRVCANSKTGRQKDREVKYRVASGTDGATNSPS